MLGFLNIIKPKEVTSHDVIAQLRKKLNIKRVGHAGTLDPMATGVLVVGINGSTRLFEYLKNDKDYIAEITFGIATDTDDITGKIIHQSDHIPNIESINNALEIFKGIQKQKPPIFSAIRIQGKRAYDLARNDLITLSEINEKEITISSISVIGYNNGKLHLKISCSHGTYIRSIARDLGENLNTYGTLSSLSRTRVGDFNLNTAIEIECINSENIANYIVLPTEVIDLEKIVIDENEENYINQGKPIKTSSEFNQKNTLFKLVNKNNVLIGIGIYDCGLIKPKKVINGK